MVSCQRSVVSLWQYSFWQWIFCQKIHCQSSGDGLGIDSGSICVWRQPDPRTNSWILVGHRKGIPGAPQRSAIDITTSTRCSTRTIATLSHFFRLEHQGRAHFFICMLAYLVEWHMRKALGRRAACPAGPRDASPNSAGIRPGTGTACHRRRRTPSGASGRRSSLIRRIAHERGRGDAAMRRTVLKRWMDLKSRWHDHAVVRLNPVSNPCKFGP